MTKCEGSSTRNDRLTVWGEMGKHFKDNDEKRGESESGKISEYKLIVREGAALKLGRRYLLIWVRSIG